MKPGPVYLLVVVSLVFAGCATNPVQTGNDAFVTKEALASYQSFGWSPQRSLNLRDPNRNTSTAQGWLEAAVESELGTKGLRKAPASEADLLASYSVASKTVANYQEFSAAGEFTGNQIDEAGGTGPLWDLRKSVDTGFEQGRILLTLTDRKSGKVVYRGSAAGALLKNPSPSRSVPLINRAVKGMLDGFPRR